MPARPARRKRGPLWPFIRRRRLMRRRPPCEACGDWHSPLQHCPTQDEIRERCAEIQAGWSETKEIKRRAGPGAAIWWHGRWWVDGTLPYYGDAVAFAPADGIEIEE